MTLDNVKSISERKNRRTYGVHLTSIDIFLEYIYPDIDDTIEDYIWIDLYCGEGNLILPILEFIPKHEKIEFFKKNIYLFDVQEEMIEKCIENATKYGIPKDIAKLNINQRDSLESFPAFLLNKKKPLYHITNPPYLYLGYIRKQAETKKHYKYFEGENEGYQDLYQIAMINDLRNGIENLIYIIPSNFIFGAAVSNKFRLDFLKYYNISKMYVFEKKIFNFTGTNICISYFKKKHIPKLDVIEFPGIKIKKKDELTNRDYKLSPKWKFRAGAEFDEFALDYKANSPLKVKYYLLNEDVKKNHGNKKITVIDTNEYVSNDYNRKILEINEELMNNVLSNILYIRTVDTGSYEGRAGLNLIKKDFNVDGIYVSKATYRTSPIQIFLEPKISIEDQHLLMDYFNIILEYFREKLDSEFLTTYKYSKADYTRKYLGLTQVRKLIETFPIIDLNDQEKELLKNLIKDENVRNILEFSSKFDKSNKIKINNNLSNWL